MVLFYAIWINAKFLRALNKTLKFDLKRDDHDSFGPLRRIAAQFFFKKAPWTKQILFLLMEWASYVAEKKWRNSVSHRNSIGRFLHGPPLKLQKTANKYAEKRTIYGSILRKTNQVIDTVNSARLNILGENYTGNFSRQTRHPPIELKTEWGCSRQQLLKF